MSILLHFRNFLSGTEEKKMNTLSILFASLCIVNGLTNVITFTIYSHQGTYPNYGPGYGQTVHKVTQVLSPGYIGHSQSSHGQGSSYGHGASGHGGQSGYGQGSNSWNQGAGGVHSNAGHSSWNQGESTSWGKEYGHSNRHNVGHQSGYGHSGYGTHSGGQAQGGYGHNSGYGFNRGGYGNQGSYGVSY